MANKLIAFLIVDNGIDGRDRETVRYAFWDEGQRDTYFAQHKNKAYYSKAERIVNVAERTETARAKLDGLDKLLLGVK